MTTINVELGDRSYPIWVERGLVSKAAEIIQTHFHKHQWLIFTQSKIAELYADSLKNKFELNDCSCQVVLLPDGEQAKSLNETERLYHQLLEHNADRTTGLIALGGGVVGDITGFVAATFMRGIDYIQFPTTLLAMVDSSIGGKTGVNLREGKNLVGAFCQPKVVIIDPDVLASLPKREVVSASAEILKYGAILDRSFFQKLSENLDTLIDSDFLTGAIIRCCELKGGIVSQDEKEGDMRRILNFGHTIGHALESITDYSTLTHGEAISYGMMAAGRISIELGCLGNDDCEFLEKTIRKLPLPPLPQVDMDEFLSLIMHDKKVQKSKLHFVVLEKIGKAFVSDKVGEELIGEILSFLLSQNTK